VHLGGYFDDDSLAAAMAISDVLVVTSAHEGFGVPVVEALVQGLPVVVNTAGALPDVVGDGGLLADATDPWAFAAAVARILTDDVLRTSLAAAGLAHVSSFALDTAGDRLVDLVSALGEC
jgi:glycosyltransferase involved in cell wall biosynthesis